MGPAGRSISRREIVDLDLLLRAPRGLVANLAHSPSAGSTLTIVGCGRSREIAVGDGGYVRARRARSREIEGWYTCLITICAAYLMHQVHVDPSTWM